MNPDFWNARYSHEHLAYGATLLVEGRLRLDGLLKRSPGAHFETRGDGTISARATVF